MKKQKLVLTGLVGFAFLFGCNQVDEGEVSASLPSDFTKVSETNIFKDEIYATILKHNKTSCYYTVSVNKYEWSSSSIEPMFIEKDGVLVPYCDKVGE